MHKRPHLVDGCSQVPRSCSCRGHSVALRVACAADAAEPRQRRLPKAPLGPLQVHRDPAMVGNLPCLTTSPALSTPIYRHKEGKAALCSEAASRDAYGNRNGEAGAVDGLNARGWQHAIDRRCPVHRLIRRSVDGLADALSQAHHNPCINMRVEMLSLK